MKIQTAFFDQEVKYKQAIKLPRNELTSNIFSKVTFTNNENKNSYAIDVFTLPGFYQSSLEDKKNAIKRFFAEHDFNFTNTSLHSPYFNSVSTDFLKNGEILFDIESALFNFIPSPLPENVVIHTNFLGISENFSDAKWVKIKIAPTKISLKELAIFLNQKSKEKDLPLLRFDGNRKFEIGDLVFFLNNLNSSVIDRIDYIEEPFKNFSDLYTFQKLYKMKIAIDESLVHFFEHFDCMPALSPIVLKPGLYGISKSYELIRKLSELSHPVIVSSSYQPASTFLPLLALAYYSDSFWPSPLYHGLDTINLLPEEYQNARVINSLSIY